MYNISKTEFNNLKKSKKSFQVIVEEDCDEITPISIFFNMQGKNKFLLESNYFNNSKGRYSFVGTDPYAIVKSYREKIFVEEGEVVYEEQGKVLDTVKRLIKEHSMEKTEYTFSGGAIGYIGYDIIKQYERISDDNVDELQIPEAILMFYKKIVGYDHLTHKAIYIYNVFSEDHASFEDVSLEIKNMKKEIKTNKGMHDIKRSSVDKNITSNFTKDGFCKIVSKAKEYIRKGDIFQVVLSQRFTMDIDEQPFDIYRKLRSRNPSPYLFYIDFGDFQITGSSPESLVSVYGDKVITNPIAGTRPRGKDEKEDSKLKNELINDEKEIAEHSMLLDLARNDIGKISEFGTVKVDKLMEVEFYSHVMHIVSEVSGKLKDGFDCFDALKTCIPAGTVSGAPKIRAMEIIDELENVKRGCYAGAVGYFSFDGNMDTCIAIRTLVIKNKKAYAQAGGGIVYDSIPENEYQESLNKSKILKEVI
ncbi:MULTISPECIES: anthranilate synthase component I [Clostridium]|uniref:anthranilate synthase component I n=1 Tax=Clostridium TaxID=1485 RepID=UPI00069EB7C3|nr:anthranilate synthase component I [Clostridium sp. DMHC 10]KOF56853.1 anthranilate synthase subunit I [Clostridium sp. DMHC 10]MCD2348408.1 anthranilate synthase component I [Clostridium guangxiense]